MSSFINEAIGTVTWVGLNAAFSAGAAEIFGISTPKAMAVHSIGMSVAGLALRQLVSESSDPTTETLKALGVIILSHNAGQELAQYICNVNVAAKDIFKSVAATATVTLAVLAVVNITAAIV